MKKYKITSNTEISPEIFNYDFVNVLYNKCLINLIYTIYFPHQDSAVQYKKDIQNMLDATQETEVSARKLY